MTDRTEPTIWNTRARKALVYAQVVAVLAGVGSLLTGELAEGWALINAAVFTLALGLYVTDPEPFAKKVNLGIAVWAMVATWILVYGLVGRTLWAPTP